MGAMRDTTLEGFIGREGRSSAGSAAAGRLGREERLALLQLLLVREVDPATFKLMRMAAELG